VRELVFALDADAAGQQQWRQLARQAALPAAAYGGHKDVNEAWAAGVLAVGVGPAAAGREALAVFEDVREALAERVAIMVTDGSVRRGEAERLAWAGLQAASAAR